MPQPSLLVVEDDPTTRDALRRIFKLKGWSVRVASTVAEGLTMLDPPPDFLILDLMLPDGGGEVVLRQIRSDGMATRVAICTGVNDPARLEAVSALRPDAVLRKPVDLAALSLVLGLTT